MKIAYISSWLPTMNDTFVVREILELANEGNEVSIFVLRNIKSVNSGNRAKQIKNKSISIKEFKFNLYKLLIDLMVLSTKNFSSLIKCFYEVILSSFCQPHKSHHFLYIFSAAIFFSKECFLRDIGYIHSHFLHSESVGARWISLLSKIPYGITIHTSKIRYSNKLISRVVNDSSLSFADTEEGLSFMKTRFKKDGVLIRNGVDISSFEYKEPVDLKNRNSPVYILACGTLIKPKGFHILIEACKKLKEMEIKFKCKIVGEGEERKRLETLGKELIRQGFLELAGVLDIDSLKEEYKKADIFVMPSIPSEYGRDGLPTVLIEAMACGIPIIGTKHAAIPEIIENGKTGLLIPPNQVEDLTEAINKYLNNFELYAKISLQARKKIEEEYDIKKNFKTFKRMLKKIDFKQQNNFRKENFNVKKNIPKNGSKY